MDDLAVLARTLFGEARGEYEKTGLAAFVAVANVVLNRKESGKYGSSLAGVCLRPWQFSCWNPSDPNYPLLTDSDLTHPLLETCHTVAKAVAEGLWPDLTKGSTHYHATTIPPPRWAHGQKPTITLGHHIFYRL